MAGDLATSRWQAPTDARTIGCPSSTRSVAAAAKRCRARNSTTLRWASLSGESPRLAGRTANFRPSVSGSRSARISHLNPREYLTPYTHETERNHKREHDGIGNEVAPFIVNCVVVAAPYAH